jgi:GNAT superfamily N-acetyltransferase
MSFDTIGTETTKNNEQLIIKHSSELAHSPAYTFFLRQMADLMDNGHSAKMTTWVDSECGIVWAEIDSKIVGIFAYKKDQLKYKVLNILLTAVDANHRNKGIHTILNRYFEKTALDLGCNITVATVHPNNKTRLATAEKDGLKIFYHKLYKKLTPGDL